MLGRTRSVGSANPIGCPKAIRISRVLAIFGEIAAAGGGAPGSTFFGRRPFT